MKEIQQTYIEPGNKINPVNNEVREFKVPNVMNIKGGYIFLAFIAFMVIFLSIAALMMETGASVSIMITTVFIALFLLFWFLRNTLYKPTIFLLDNNKLTIRTKNIIEIYFNDIASYSIIFQNAVRLELSLKTGKKIKLVSGLDSTSTTEMENFTNYFDQIMQHKIVNADISATRQPSWYESKFALPFLIIFTVLIGGALAAVMLWSKNPSGAGSLFGVAGVLLSMWTGYFIIRKKRQKSEA